MVQLLKESPFVQPLLLMPFRSHTDCQMVKTTQLAIMVARRNKICDKYRHQQWRENHRNLWEKCIPGRSDWIHHQQRKNLWTIRRMWWKILSCEQLSYSGNTWKIRCTIGQHRVLLQSHITFDHYIRIFVQIYYNTTIW